MLRQGRKKTSVCLAIALLASAASAGTARAAEPFFPDAGSRAIDVRDYGVRLAYPPTTGSRASRSCA